MRSTTTSRVAREAISAYLAHGQGIQSTLHRWTGTTSSLGHFELSYAKSSAAETAGDVENVAVARKRHLEREGEQGHGD